MEEGCYCEQIAQWDYKKIIIWVGYISQPQGGIPNYLLGAYSN